MELIKISINENNEQIEGDFRGWGLGFIILQD